MNEITQIMCFNSISCNESVCFNCKKSNFYFILLQKFVLGNQNIYNIINC